MQFLSPRLVPKEDVVRQFLRVERKRLKRFDTLRADFQERINAFVAEQQEPAEKILADYLDAVHDQDNPVGTWLLRRSEQIAHWIYVGELPFWLLYSPRVNKDLNAALTSAGGNVAKFATEYADHFPDQFPDRGRLPESLDQILIGVADHRNDRVEVLDGFHRAVELIRSGAVSGPVFVAETQ